MISRKTAKGTEYSVDEWTCDVCKEKKSALIIDEEVVYGDSRITLFKGREKTEGCVYCILNI